MSKVNVFICYAHEDRSYLDKLVIYLNEKAIPKINVWYDGEIALGRNWNKVIQDKVDNADIILLLISQPFLMSEYINQVELKKAMERHASGKSRVILIFIRKCELKRYPVITDLQGLPDGGRFFSEMGSEADSHYTILQQKIDAIAEELTLNNDLSQAVDKNDLKGNMAREIIQLRDSKRIFLSVTANEEGMKRRRNFLFEVEGRKKYESWPFEISPGINELQEQKDKDIATTLQKHMEESLYSILIVSHSRELMEDPCRAQYEMACRQIKKEPFHRLIIWYLDAGVRDSMDEAIVRELSTHANVIGYDYENIFELVKSLEIEREQQLLQLKKKFSDAKKVLMLYHFNTDHNSDLRIQLKTKIEDNKLVSFRFNVPQDNLQKEKEELEICHGALIFYGHADPHWYLMRQSLLLEAQNIKSRAVCIDEPEIDVKIRRDVYKREFITIKGADELDARLNDFLNSL